MSALPLYRVVDEARSTGPPVLQLLLLLLRVLFLDLRQGLRAYLAENGPVYGECRDYDEDNDDRGECGHCPEVADLVRHDCLLRESDLFGVVVPSHIVVEEEHLANSELFLRLREDYDLKVEVAVRTIVL